MRAQQSSLINLIQRTIGQPTFGAEVGVWRGLLSESLLGWFPRLTLAMVDPWLPYPQMPMTPAIESEARQRTKRFRGRARIYKGLSVEMAERFYDKSLDFVFIDADHRYEHIKADIAAWYPKIRQGGLLSGHDYGGRRYHKGVKRAVTEFIDEYGGKLILKRGRVWGVKI